MAVAAGRVADWAFRTPVPQAATLLCLDLADLPGCLNLLPRLEKAGWLDVRVDTRTEVDFMRLELITACPDHELALGYGPGPDTYYHDAFVNGLTTTFSVDANSSHANGFAIILAGSAIGGFPFPSLCLFDAPLHFMVALDGAGAGTLSLSLSGLPPCMLAHTQAVAIKSNFSFLPADLKWSHTISDYVH